MRPLRLTMRAFGPYPEEETIDFTKLGAAPLFLISGPTGAGKTSILDGICYALYGDSSGGKRDGRALRSDFADAKLSTQVTFTFALGKREYRVQRSPVQELAKQKGTGLTTKAPEAALWDEDKLIESKVVDVTRRVTELLGFKDDQFRQVVLLPQGDFQKFLLAKPSERETILAVLFQTHLYRRAEDTLKEQAKALGTKFQDVTSQQKALLSHASCDTSDALTERLNALASELTTLEENCAKAAAKLADAEKGWADAQRVAALFTAHEKALTQRAELEAKLDKAAATEAQLATAQRADAAWPAVENARDWLANATNAHTRATAAKERSAKAQATLTLASAEQANSESLRPQRETAMAESAKLSALRPTVAKLSTLEKAAHDTARTHDLASAQLPLAMLEAERAVAAIEAKRTQEQREIWDRATAELALLAPQAASAEQAEAAALAARLVDGEACPVCGSLDHPSPAHDEGQRGDWRKLSERVAILREQLIGLPPNLPANAKALADDAARLHAESRAAAKNSAGIEAIAQQRVRAATELAGVLEAIPEPLRTTGALERAIEALTRRSSQLDALLAKAQKDLEAAQKEASAAEAAAVETLRAQTEAETRRDETAAACTAALAANGFPDADSVSAARIPNERQAAWTQHLRDFREQLAVARAQAQSASTAIEGLAHPDLAAAEDSHQSAKAEATLVTSEFGKRTQEHSMLAGLSQQVARLQTEAAEVEREYRLVGRISQVVRGENARKLSLQEYAQMAYLRDVLAAATVRLRRMSGGRYELHHPPNAQGLELRVLDYYTGHMRGVETLSGGEMFLASLSLALGLSDVVQAESGGVRLDSLFVDEGFGTLDPEVLDLAMDTLADLQRTGRLVGLISHVAEMKERIPLRLEVIPGPRGSRTRITGPYTN